jgi:hypothetical protein
VFNYAGSIGSSKRVFARPPMDKDVKRCDVGEGEANVKPEYISLRSGVENPFDVLSTADECFFIISALVD